MSSKKCQKVTKCHIVTIAQISSLWPTCPGTDRSAPLYGLVMPRLFSLEHFAHREGHISRITQGTPRASLRARQERVSPPHEGPRARKNVTHIVTILCVQGAPRYPPLLPRYTNHFSFFISYSTLFKLLFPFL